MTFSQDAISLNPIGFLHARQIHKHEVPRQPCWAHNTGTIELNRDLPFKEMLCGLEGFSHIWVLFHFHQNQDWKASVKPPYKGQQKVGVLASRSPYRPNGIGMSVLQLERIHGHQIFVKNHDLLHGTPILDIKPYIVSSDSVVDAQQGWRASVNDQLYPLNWAPTANEKCNWIQDNAPGDILGAIHAQLTHDPLNLALKRIKKRQDCNTVDSLEYIYSYRTWRIHFRIIDTATVFIFDIQTGYSEQELCNTKEDPVGDKGIHRQFVKNF